MEINNLMDKLVKERQEKCDHFYQFRRVVPERTIQTRDGLTTIPSKVICDNCGMENDGNSE